MRQQKNDNRIKIRKKKIVQELDDKTNRQTNRDFFFYFKK